VIDFDLINNLDNEKYQPLLDAFTYFGISYAHDGIKALLADYFMAKYVLQVNTNFGPFGATNKAPQDGEIADRNSLKDIAHNKLLVHEIIKLYLIANYQIFTEWRNPILLIMLVLYHKEL
jgi:hypothetical protein